MSVFRTKVRAAFAGGLIVISFFACKPGATVQDSSKPTSNPGETIPSTEPIVFVNSDSLLSKYDYYKEVKSQMEDKGKSLQGDVERKGRSFQAEVQAYQKNMVNLTPQQKQETEARLGKKQQDLQAYQQNLSQQLSQEEAEINQKLYAKVQTYLKDYCVKNHHKMVLTYSKGGNLLYGDQILDVTTDVVKGLNDVYKVEKAGK